MGASGQPTDKWFLLSSFPTHPVPEELCPVTRQSRELFPERVCIVCGKPPHNSYCCPEDAAGVDGTWIPS